MLAVSKSLISWTSRVRAGSAAKEIVTETRIFDPVELARAVQGRVQCGEVQSVLAMAGCFQANYGIAKKWCVRMIETAKRSGNKMHIAWA
jgi:hypothetical protein